MIPPFFAADLRIGPQPLPFEERRILRRGAPERLRFDLPPPGQPAFDLRALPPERPARERQGRFGRLAAMVRLWAPA